MTSTYSPTRELVHTAEVPGPLSRWSGRTMVLVLMVFVTNPVIISRPVYAIPFGLALGCLLLAPRAAVLRAPISLVVLLAVAWASASVTWSTDFGASFGDVKVDMPLMVLAVAVAGVLPVEDIVISAVRGARVVLAMNVVALIVDPSKRGVLIEGWIGLTSSKNSLGIATLLMAITILTLDRSRWPRYIGLLTSVVLLIGSKAVGAMGAAVVVCLLAVWLTMLRTRDDRSGSAFAISTVLLAGCALGAVLSALGTVVALFGKDLTFTGRASIWGAVWRAGLERPFLGWGRGALFGDESARAAEIYAEVGFRPSNTHNGALGLWVELGLPGLILGLVILALGLLLGVRLFRRRPEISSWLIITSIAVAQIGLTEQAYWTPYAWLTTFQVVVGMRCLARGRAGSDPALPEAAAGRRVIHS